MYDVELRIVHFAKSEIRYNINIQEYMQIYYINIIYSFIGVSGIAQIVILQKHNYTCIRL